MRKKIMSVRISEDCITWLRDRAQTHERTISMTLERILRDVQKQDAQEAQDQDRAQREPMHA